MKKIIIIVVILVLISAIAIMYMSWNAKVDQANAQTQFDNENTTGTGLIGQLSSLWSTLNIGDKEMSETDALGLSVQISNEKEKESDSGNALAQELILEMYNGGWEYLGYNQVKKIGVT